MIALSYGPWMTLGSLYLHTERFSWGALAASLVPGLLIGSLAIVNAIPDFHQDSLVGKRNLVVRFGRRNGVYLYLSASSLALTIIIAGALFGLFPKVAIVAALFSLPLLWNSGKAALATYEEPRRFIPAVRAIVLCYVTATGLFAASLLL
jgi:1,4-dihydroxy-2-naphthoate octaprenyltransferase